MHILLGIMLCASGAPGETGAAADRVAAVQQRKQAFLVQLADRWREAGYPIAWKHEEWKFDEIEPNWAGALAAMSLKRTPEELAKANAFFAAMPLDEKIDPDMRVCEALHAYYLLRDDPDLDTAGRRRLLEIARFRPAPRRIHPSIWRFGATENHAFMGHVWCLLVAQIDRDRGTAAVIGQHIEAFVVEHIRKGWLEYNSPCYVEKEAGCLLMLAEWAEDPLLRYKAELGLDVLLAEHAALNLEGMLCGPACRVYRPGAEGILSDELNHNSRRDAACSGSYPLMYMLFGQGRLHDYGVLGAPLLATSRYVAPRAVHALATAGESRGCYAFKARRPGRMHQRFRNDLEMDQPPPEAFDARVYAWVTPDFVLGSFQEVEGEYGATRSLPLTSVLRMAGSTRRAIYTNLLLGEREVMATAGADCAQHENVALGRGIVGEAYFATDEFDETVEREGWLFVRAGGTFAAYRVIGSDYTWQHVEHPSIHGDFMQFGQPGAPFVLEAARATDYEGDFGRFHADVLDNRIEQTADGVSYESCSQGLAGPSARAFTLTLRYGQVLLVDGEPVDLAGYGTFDSPYLQSAWDSGIVRLNSGSERLTINVQRGRSPIRIEETIEPRSLPYASDFDRPDDSWAAFLNYWRLNGDQWHWSEDGGRPGGCLKHDAARGVSEEGRGAHDAAMMLRGGEGWTDYVLEADARAARGTFGLWVRADMQDEGGGNGRWVQGYYFVLDPGHHRCRLWRARKDGLVPPGGEGKPEQNQFSNPVLLVEADLPPDVSYGEWLRLRVEARGDQLGCFVNGQRVISAADGTYPSGSAGFTTYKATDVRFDNVRVVPE